MVILNKKWNCAELYCLTSCFDNVEKYIISWPMFYKNKWWFFVASFFSKNRKKRRKKCGYSGVRTNDNKRNNYLWILPKALPFALSSLLMKVLYYIRFIGKQPTMSSYRLLLGTNQLNCPLPVSNSLNSFSYFQFYSDVISLINMHAKQAH